VRPGSNKFAFLCLGFCGQTDLECKTSYSHQQNRTQPHSYCPLGCWARVYGCISSVRDAAYALNHYVDTFVHKFPSKASYPSNFIQLLPTEGPSRNHPQRGHQLAGLLEDPPHEGVCAPCTTACAPLEPFSQKTINCETLLSSNILNVISKARK
jgi:hypothetical protein